MFKTADRTLIAAPPLRGHAWKIAFGALWSFQIGLLLTGCSSPASHGSFSALPPAKAVNITTWREGETTHFYVENKEFCEITMTFEMGLANLKGNSTFPYTATFPARETTEAFVVSPVDSKAKWEYSYTNYYKLGGNRARHDDSCVYQLPYEPERDFKVTQGYNGKYSHKGSNQYAIDWQMPEGTPVRAARGGIVVKVKDDSNKGGSSLKFDPYNNYVLIRHEDGTLGHYCHLQQGGALIKVGQVVEAGEFIAHSGNTGFSSGPHLHFCVFRTVDGRRRVSIPVKFQTAVEPAVTLLSGRSYKATSSSTSLAQSQKAAGVHFGAAAAP